MTITDLFLLDFYNFNFGDDDNRILLSEDNSKLKGYYKKSNPLAIYVYAVRTHMMFGRDVVGTTELKLISRFCHE